jgi:CubicO group peptidase (beta-lactamase class C family)
MLYPLFQIDIHRDDPIDQYIPSFAYRPYGWSSKQTIDLPPVTRPPITFRQLASHLSGLSRDLPPTNILNPTSPTEEWNGTRPEVTVQSILETIRSTPLVAPQWTYPIYSNTGFCVLGWANLAAAQMATAKEGLQPIHTFPQLMKRDIFGPLGMNSSFFSVPPGYEGRLAVSRVQPEEAVQTF